MLKNAKMMQTDFPRLGEAEEGAPPRGDEYDTTELMEREKDTEKLTPPPFYRVLILNDDFTPMEFVVYVLTKIFHIEEERAVQLMLQVHHEGRAICGIYTKDVAQTKVEWVRKLAVENNHPLACEWEKHT